MDTKKPTIGVHKGGAISFNTQGALNSFMTKIAAENKGGAVSKRNVTPGGSGGGAWLEGKTRVPNGTHVTGFFSEATPVAKAGALKRDFFYVPSTLLSARDGWWQDRKRRWIALGIRSELGRGAAPGGSAQPGQRASDAEKYGGQSTVDRVARKAEERRAAVANASNLTFVRGARDLEELDTVSAKILEVAEGGTSIFDPVLCEILYRWFCPTNGRVLDPFAGGSVRGIVASALGLRYTGVDLAELQIAANQMQWNGICADGGEALGPTPNWICGDSNEVIPTLAGGYDFVMSCPPYADLEVYSDDPRDISSMSYEVFRDVYAKIIAAACEKLKPNRFAAFVVGDARGKDGAYYGFPEDTVRAFQDAGLKKYNELILVTAMGSAAIRARMGFAGSRKVVKTHQNILVFVKGDPKKATRAIDGPRRVSIPEPIQVGRSAWPAEG